jgi:NAD-dependent dihydropyrimidine dehydrogenase PreA subunit
VTRSSNTSAISVNYATASSTASSPSDFATVPLSTLNFPAGGSLTQTVSVSVIGDTTVETNETFFVNLSNCIGCVIADSQGVGTITNDDSSTQNISINDVTLTEGNSGTKNYVFTITRSSNAASSVQYATSSNTAVSPTDYTAIPLTTINFAAGGSLTQTITVSVNGDTTAEPNETFFVNLSNCVGCTITDSQGVGTITNDDTVPQISINDVTQSEGNSGTSNFVFTVTRSGDTTGVSSINFATANVSAKSTDYTAKSGTLSFAAGETTKSISISVISDTNREKRETFNVNLSNPIGCTISDSLGVGTILNDD